MPPSPLDSHRYPQSKFEVQWDGSTWTDESQYLISHSGELKISGPGEDMVAPGDVGAATVLLWNEGGRFSWLRSDGGLFAYIGGRAGMYGIPARLSVGLGTAPGAGVTAWHRIFTGVIYDWSENSRDRTVTLELRDLGHRYVQQRATTTIYEDLRLDEWIQTLATLAGISAVSLDPSPVTVDYCWLDDESILGEMWEAARADGGRCYFDRGGTLRYEHPSHWAIGEHAGSPVWMLDEDDYQLVAPEVSVDELVSQVRVEIQPRAVGPDQVLYTLDQARVIPPGGTAIIDCRMSYPVLALGTLVANDNYEIITAGGEDLSGTCSISLTAYAQRARLQIVNPGTIHQAYLTMLALRGSPLIGGPTLEISEDVAGSVPYTRIRGISGNPYLQSEDVARMLAQMLRDRGARLHPVYTLRGIPGIPNLNLGDRIRFQDASAMSGTRDGFVVGIRWTADEGFTQDVTLLDATELFLYDNYFIVGTTALGAHGRCWY